MPQKDNANPIKAYLPISDPTSLRAQAEKHISENEPRLPENLDRVSLEQMQRILHELRVHQIELEMQNDELRRVQAELEDSQARYFDLFHLAPLGYLVLNQMNIILDTNRMATQLLALARDRVIEQPFNHFIFSEDQDIYYHYSRQILAQAAQQNNVPQVCILRIRRAGGAWFWAKLETSLAQDTPTGLNFRMTMDDISESKYADTILRESEARYHDILEYAPLGFFQSYPDGIYRNLNPRMAHIFGYESTDEMIDSITDIAHQIYADPLIRQEFNRQLLQDGRVVDFVTQYRHKDGSLFWGTTNARLILNEQGLPFYIEGFIQDIDRRIQTEHKA